MLKTKVKIIITLIAVFIIMCLLNVNTVQAVEMTETDRQQIFDLVPNEMELQISEIEYEKAGDIIIENVKKILDDKNIQYEKTEKNRFQLKDATINGYVAEITTSGPYLNLELGGIHQASITIRSLSSTTNQLKTKTVDLIYSNSSKYNSEDEKYVKSLKTECPIYYELTFDDIFSENALNNFYKAIGEYHTSQIKDESIIIKGSSSAGGADGMFNIGEEGTCIGIFKNDILYEVRNIGSVTSIPVINIPYTISEDDFNNYIINFIKQYYPEYVKTITKIEKGTPDLEKRYNVEIPESYTIYSSEINGYIIIRKEKTYEDLQKEIFDLIPDLINLDIPESEFQKVDELIMVQIKEKLDKKGMQYEEIKNNVIKLKNLTMDVPMDIISVRVPSLVLAQIEKEEFYKTSINVLGASKKIQIKYSNTDKYNEKDEVYAKKIKIKNPIYYEIPAMEEINGDNNCYEEFAGKYLTKLINDNSIVIGTDSEAGGGFNWGHSDTVCGIFKDGVLYELRTIGKALFIPVITVPKEIDKDKVADYVLDFVKKYYSFEFTDIVEGCTGDLKERYGKVPKNVYTLTYDDKYDDGCKGYVIVKQEKKIESKEEKTKIKFEATTEVVPEDTKLVVEEVKEEKIIETIKETLKEVSNKYVVFDISLISQEEKIQPNGKVKISIPVPDGYDESKLIVYRIEEDGTKIEFKVEIVEVDNVKYVQFETDHFSNYVLAEKTIENTERVLDNEPKTGIADIKLIVGIVMIICVVAVVKIKKTSK